MVRTNPAYGVDLFYGNVGFTADYSNVLQFDDTEARDEYFDGIDHISILNTDLNNVNITGNTVKIAFTSIDDLDKLEKFNYIRIYTTLNGDNVISKTEYGFIVDFNIISSYSDITVVEFTYIVDIWQNYQFDFELKECNVDRSHVDRWDSNGNMIYTRPSKDALESYMIPNIAQNFKFTKEVYCFELTNAYDEDDNRYAQIKRREKDIVLCVVSIASNGTDNKDSNLQYIYFPLAIDGTAIVEATDISEDTLFTSDDLQGRILRIYPTIKEILGGNIAGLFDIVPSSIFNSQIIVSSSIDIANVDFEIGTIAVKGTIIGNSQDKIITHPIYFLTYNLAHSAYKYVGDINFDVTPAYLPWADEISLDVNISLPVKPNDNDTYSYTHEPMLYKNPVMKRFISSANGNELYEIPDIKFPFSKIYVNNYISPGEGITEITTESMENIDTKLAENSVVGALGSFLTTKTDLLTDVWKEYCMTQRDSDRKMMWSNILTGGVAETGSTAVSAGIGYRSNQERADLYEALGNMNAIAGTPGSREKAGMNYHMQGVYEKYGKNAMYMSGVGGVTAFASNAIGNAVGQYSKEQAIKNRPANVGNVGGWFGEITKNIIYPSYIEIKCDDKSYEQYANIFNKFGYAINGVITPNIKSRKYFNYIKTNGAILTGDANQSILVKLCSIFDNGVTIWHMDYAKDSLYDYTKENIERSLM